MRAHLLLPLVGVLVASAPAAAEPTLGVMADVGLPDGGNVSVVVRPVRALRLHAGAAHNGIAPGLRGGLTFIPFRTWLSPTLTADAGEFREGDIPMLDDDTIGYRYAAARVGLEMGHDRFTFYIHGGASRLWGQLHDDDMGDVKLTVTSVSARVGIILYL